MLGGGHSQLLVGLVVDAVAANIEHLLGTLSGRKDQVDVPEPLLVELVEPGQLSEHLRFGIAGTGLFAAGP